MKPDYGEKDFWIYSMFLYVYVIFNGMNNYNVTKKNDSGTSREGSLPSI